MSRPHLKSYSELALLLAALLTGSLITTMMPAGRMEASNPQVTHRTVSSADTVDVIGFDVDVRRLSEIACVI